MACSALDNRIVILLLTFISVMSCNTENRNTIGVISSASPEASKAGQEIFLKGGNAVDAAVAVSFALGVTEPAMSGLGGGTQVLISLENGQPFAINGTTLSPAMTPTNISDTLTFHRRSTIPSTVKVLDYLWKTYGSGEVSWEELLKPAIELAENGFTVGKFRAKVFKQYEDKLLESKFNTSFILIDGNRIPNEGEILKQPILAKTLKRLAKYGANDFYNGEIAKKIAWDMEKHGGWITLSDLNNFPSPKELNALSVNYKGMNIYSQPPPCGGWTTLLALNF
jgi:gamma-glutamyltranspeptidase/glutathione hydrolase